MKSIVEELKQNKILVSDGGWGTYLYAKGLQMGDCPELWNETHKDDVFEIAESYNEAPRGRASRNSVD